MLGKIEERIGRLPMSNRGVVGEFWRASILCVRPFHPVRAPFRSDKRIGKVLGFPRDLVTHELHDAHGVGRVGVIGEDEFGDQRSPPPMIRRTVKRFLFG